MKSETLICDTSFISHLLNLDEAADRYAHWDEGVMDRVESEILAISVVTVAEVRAGYHLPLMIDDPHLNEWARLRVAAWRRGVALSDNDLWIAATASVRSRVLVTCDRDHLRIAPALAGEVLYLAPPV